MKNPLRVYEDFKCSSVDDFDYIERYYFFKIMNLFCARYKWSGLPPEIQPFYIEQVLFWRANGVFIYDDVVDKYAFTKLNLSGIPDIYNIPSDRWAYAPNGYIESYGKENSVILWDNIACYPFCYTARMYARSLANTWKTRDLNMFAQRTPVVLACTDEQKLTYQILGEQYSNFVPIMKVNDTVDLDRIKVLKLDAPFIVDKCEQEIRSLLSQVLTDLGYESNPIEKRERVVVGETQGNNGETEGMRNTGLVLRERCANAINKLWGLNVKVAFSSILPSMVNGFIPETFTQTGKVGEVEGGVV